MTKFMDGPGCDRASPSSLGDSQLTTLFGVDGWYRGGVGDGKEGMAHSGRLGETLRCQAEDFGL